MRVRIDFSINTALRTDTFKIESTGLSVAASPPFFILFLLIHSISQKKPQFLNLMLRSYGLKKYPLPHLISAETRIFAGDSPGTPLFFHFKDAVNVPLKHKLATTVMRSPNPNESLPWLDII